MLSQQPPVHWFEILANNHTASGGLIPWQLAAVRADYPVTFHCVGMSLGGTDPLDYDYLCTIKRLMQTYEPAQVRDYIPVTERIALEMARNHIKLKPLDVETDNTEDIRGYFTDLEFVPVESSLLASADLELMGGRYCSIQSVPAAQLRITVPYSNRLQTLYQTEYRKDVFGPLPVLENGHAPVAVNVNVNVNVNVKGITVRIWVEKGLLFALTDEAGLEPIIPPE